MVTETQWLRRRPRHSASKRCDEPKTMHKKKGGGEGACVWRGGRGGEARQEGQGCTHLVLVAHRDQVLDLHPVRRVVLSVQLVRFAPLGHALLVLVAVAVGGVEELEVRVLLLLRAVAVPREEAVAPNRTDVCDVRGHPVVGHQQLRALVQLRRRGQPAHLVVELEQQVQLDPLGVGDAPGRHIVAPCGVALAQSRMFFLVRDPLARRTGGELLARGLAARRALASGLLGPRHRCRGADGGRGALRTVLTSTGDGDGR